MARAGGGGGGRLDMFLRNTRPYGLEALLARDPGKSKLPD